MCRGGDQPCHLVVGVCMCVCLCGCGCLPVRGVLCTPALSEDDWGEHDWFWGEQVLSCGEPEEKLSFATVGTRTERTERRSAFLIQRRRMIPEPGDIF